MNKNFKFSAFLLILTSYLFSCNSQISKVDKERIKNEMHKEQNKRKVFLEKYGDNADTFVDKRDGRIYLTIKIGEQTWMAENLAFEPKKDFWNYENDSAYVEKYGYLYTYKSALKSIPKGWRLPTHYDWSVFLKETKYQRINILEPDNVEIDENSEYNETGFSMLLGGWFFIESNMGDKFLGLGSTAAFWIKQNDKTDNNVVYFDLSPLESFYNLNPRGYSVRCIKDE